MLDGTVPVNEEDVATSGTLEIEGLDLSRVDRNPDRNCYTLSDGSCVSTSACMHSEWIYTVYAFGGSIPSHAYRVGNYSSRRMAEDKAKLYKGVITRSEIIGDFRNWEG